MWTCNEVGLLSNMTLEYRVNKRRALLVPSAVGESMHIYPGTLKSPVKNS